MITMNELKKSIKINKLMGILKGDSRIENPEWVLTTLYDLAARLSDAELNGWLQLEDEAARLEFLTNAYLTSGIKRRELARQEAMRVNSVDLSLIRMLMHVIAIEPLPSVEIAIQLIELWQSKNKHNSACVTMEMAELSYEIIFNPLLVSKIICGGGVSADFFALYAGDLGSVYYETGIQSSSLTKKIINIAGVDVRFSGPGEEHIIKKRNLYQAGFLSDPWGQKGFPGTGDWIDNKFTGVASEVSSLARMMDQVDGSLVCVVPSSWLYKTSARDGSLKEHIVRNRFLEAVIQLPVGILHSTNVAPALLVINTSKRRPDILFIDASGNTFTEQVSRNNKKLVGITEIASLFRGRSRTAFSELKSTEDVTEMKCNLDVKRYIRSPMSEKIDAALAKFNQVSKLNQIVHIIGCQAIKTEGGMFSKNDKVSEISAANIDQYGLIDDTKGFKSITPVDEDVDRVRKQQLQAGDVIFAVKGNVGKCALIGAEYEGYIANQSFAILRLHNNSIINEFCLFHFLQSAFGQAIVNELVSGRTASMIKIMDLKNLPVPIPTESLQADHEVLHQKVITLVDTKIKLEVIIEETISSFWPLD